VRKSDFPGMEGRNSRQPGERMEIGLRKGKLLRSGSSFQRENDNVIGREVVGREIKKSEIPQGRGKNEKHESVR